MRTQEALVMSWNYEHFNFSQVSYDKFVGKMQHAAKYFNIIFFNLKVRTIMESNQIIHGASGDDLGHFRSRGRGEKQYSQHSLSLILIFSFLF